MKTLSFLYTYLVSAILTRRKQLETNKEVLVLRNYDVVLKMNFDSKGFLKIRFT